MEKSAKGCDQPRCLLARELIDKMTVIVGNCDLLSAEVEAGSEFAKRLSLIRDAAKATATEFGTQPSEIWDAFLKAGGQNHGVC